MRVEDFTAIGRIVLVLLFLFVILTAGPVLVSAPSTVSVLFGAFVALISILGIVLCTTETFNPMLKAIYGFLNLKKGN